MTSSNDFESLSVFVIVASIKSNVCRRSGSSYAGSPVLYEWIYRSGYPKSKYRILQPFAKNVL